MVEDNNSFDLIPSSLEDSKHKDEEIMKDFVIPKWPILQLNKRKIFENKVLKIDLLNTGLR